MAHHAPRHSENVVETVIALAGQGIARSEIARQVGMTRSAVLGLLWRRGVKSPRVTRQQRSKPSKHAARKAVARKSDKKGKAEAIAAAAIKAAEIEAQAKAAPLSAGVTWADLNSSHQCRWPLDGSLWCGEAKTNGSYCDRHFNISRRPHIR